MKRNLFMIIGMVLIAMLSATACSPQPQPSQQTQEPAQPVATPAPQTGGEGEAPSSSTAESGVREDIPIMEGAKNIQASRKGQSVIYDVDGDIETVVNYYKEQLPVYGWEMAGPPDTSLASIATMLRENEAGERMTINMAGNELGGFVKITITVVPAN